MVISRSCMEGRGQRSLLRLYWLLASCFGTSYPAVGPVCWFTQPYTANSGLSQTLWQLALARVLVGMGASGVLLIAIIVLTGMSGSFAGFDQD